MAPAAAALIGIGLAYQRAVITVLDPAGLEQAACECYHMFKEQFERFPGKSIA